ncbi:hypothetical protein P3W45_000101 [Vairimorpha bombi]|jgi:CDP-diacylglycerol---glycerol-3-phosphate 3-phosphatidyltransferase
MESFLESFTDFKLYSVDEIESLEYPENFYKALKCYLRTSNDTLIYTMYVGYDGLIKDILDIIKQRKIQERKTRIVLDKNRGLTKQLDKFIKDHCMEDFFEFKDLSCAIQVSRFKEISAVFHSKLYMFDSDIIISGANLDNSYLTNRLDRYFLIKNGILSEDIRQQTFNIVDQKLKHDTDYLFTFDQGKELDVISRIMDTDFDSVYLSSAYLNFPAEYFKLFNKQRNFSIFVNSPKMNHFDNFGTMGNIVTNVYKYSSYYALKHLNKASLYEFEIDGFTMHKKGIWAFKDEMCVTIIGSSNFNRRSVERDEEFNFCVITSKKETVKLFKNEILFLKEHSLKKEKHDYRFVWYDLIYIIIFYIFNKYF